MSDDESEAPQYAVRYEGEEESHPFVSKDGRAVASFPNGDQYEGPFVGGKRHGDAGKYTWTSGAVYEGAYAEGRKEGQGALRLPDGSEYSGHFRADLFHGQGVYQYANGDKYVGGWRAGLKHGRGTYALASPPGTTLAGTWIEGELAFGTYRQADGTVYAGTFRRNRPSGAGHFIFSHGGTDSGAYEGAQWTREVRVEAGAGEAAAAGRRSPADPLTRLTRLVARSTTRRQAAAPEGGPAGEPLGDQPLPGGAAVLRAAGGGGLPSATGLAALEKSRVVWLSVREDPQAVVNGRAHRAAAKAGAPAPDFSGATRELLEQLEDQLALQAAAEAREAGTLEFWDESGEQRASEPLAAGSAPASLRAAFEALAEEAEDAGLELAQVPLPAGGGAPAPAALDALGELARGVEDDGAAVVVAGAAGAAATAAAALHLVRRALAGEEEEEGDGDEAADEEEEEEDDEEDDEDDEELDDEERAARAERRAAKAAAKEAKEAEAAAKAAAEAAGEAAGEPDVLGALAPLQAALESLPLGAAKVRADVEEALGKAGAGRGLAEARAAGDLAAGRAWVARFARLAAFRQYLADAAEDDFEQPFGEWLAAEPHAAARDACAASAEALSFPSPSSE